MKNMKTIIFKFLVWILVKCYKEEIVMCDMKIGDLPEVHFTSYEEMNQFYNSIEDFLPEGLWVKMCTPSFSTGFRIEKNQDKR